jgi:N-acetylmuramoyl-L-alanine amidase CwlA
MQLGIPAGTSGETMQLDEAFAQLNLVQDFVPVGSSNRPGRRLAVTTITIHNTDNSNKGANAAAHARYMKGADARKRQVSWHFTVDDTSVYQSIPTNETAWHTATSKGNNSSIGVEICMNSDLDVSKAYDRAALLAALMAQRFGLKVPDAMRQHHDWSGKDCPTVLRHQPNGWEDFLKQVKAKFVALKPVPTVAIKPPKDDHFSPTVPNG